MSGQAANDAGNGRGAGVASAIRDVSKMLESNYRQNTPTRLRLLDTFLVFLFVTGVLQAWPDGPVRVRLRSFHARSIFQLAYYLSNVALRVGVREALASIEGRSRVPGILFSSWRIRRNALTSQEQAVKLFLLRICSVPRVNVIPALRVLPI